MVVAAMALQHQKASRLPLVSMKKIQVTMNGNVQIVTKKIQHHSIGANHVSNQDMLLHPP
jgi:hypothetical protein